MKQRANVPEAQRTALIIPQRNHGEMTRNCVESLRRCEPDRCSILVVDDGSSDDSANAVRSAGIIDCEVLEQAPLGVTAAWNAGIAHCRTPEIVLLNNDVQIQGPFLDRLLAPLRDGSAAITGAEWRVEPLIPARLLPRLPGRRLLAGWCLAFRRELWSRLDGFDERFALYFSDTDFQCRAAESAGDNQTPLVAVSQLPLVHLGHRTTRGSPHRRSRWQSDRERFLEKYGPECLRLAVR